MKKYLLILSALYIAAMAIAQDVLVIPYDATSLTEEQRNANPDYIVYPATLEGVDEADMICNQYVDPGEKPEENPSTTPKNPIIFDANVDNEGIGATSFSDATSYSITKDGVTITVSNGYLNDSNPQNKYYIINNNQTLTITSTAGYIKSIEVICNPLPYGWLSPVHFTTWSSGLYTYSDTTGTWTGGAREVVLTAASTTWITQIVITFPVTQ